MLNVLLSLQYKNNNPCTETKHHTRDAKPLHYASEASLLLSKEVIE